MIDLTVQLEFLHQRGLISKRRNDEVAIPELNARLARVGHFAGRQVVVVDNRPVALDGHLAPEVVKLATSGRRVLEEDLRLVDDGWHNNGWILGLSLIIRDD